MYVLLEWERCLCGSLSFRHDIWLCITYKMGGKKMKRRGSTVSAPGWVVTVRTSSAWKGAVLTVFRTVKTSSGEVFARGWLDDTWFRTQEAAWDAAYTHGYIQDYRTAWCPDCRVRHRFINRRTSFCRVHKKFN